jgi:hypothetical protein
MRLFKQRLLSFTCRILFRNERYPSDPPTGAPRNTSQYIPSQFNDGNKMYALYAFATPNSIKSVIALEELNLDYDIT